MHQLLCADCGVTKPDARETVCGFAGIERGKGNTVGHLLLRSASRSMPSALARCLLIQLPERPLAEGAMERTNLAAAIVRCAGSGVLTGEPERSEYLTHEDAINLANWLQYESPINAWRGISLKRTCPAPDPQSLRTTESR
jgi:hypothetical protein